MREIKFRAWDSQKKKMRYALMGMALDHSDSEEVMNVDYMFEWKDIYPIMQFTGLNDKNGTDIYEGDIVKHFQGIDKVWFDKDRFAVGNWSPDNGLSEFGVEVIGNIYENGDLLK